MDPVLVATDSEEVAAVCRARGIPVEMTSPACASGSDRVREVARQVDADIYVNIQGDEPTLTPEFFRPLLALFERPEVEVATLAVRCPIEDIGNPNAVKVVMALDGRALYFSRATIPFDRDSSDLPGIASTWASMLTGRPRWNGLPRLRPLRLKNWSDWNNCGCSRMALGSTSPMLPAIRLAWIQKRTWRGPSRYCTARSFSPTEQEKNCEKNCAQEPECSKTRIRRI